MNDVTDDHAARAAEANAKLVQALEAMRLAAEQSVAQALGDFGSAVGAALASIAAAQAAVKAKLQEIVGEAAVAVAEAMAENLIAIHASDAAMRHEFSRRFDVLANGLPPDPLPRIADGPDSAPEAYDHDGWLRGERTADQPIAQAA